MRNNKSIRLLVASNVRAEMGRANANQSATASAIGMSQAALSKRLTGRIPFTVDELGALADFLGTPVEAFLVSAPRAVPA